MTKSQDLTQYRETTFKLDNPLAAKTLPSSQFNVFESRPADPGKIKGGIVVVQEIFGVNSHIRAVARNYADLGYVAWAPSFFDHVESGLELAYDPAGMAQGRELVGKLGWDVPVEDARLAAVAMRQTLPKDNCKINLVGYCWGGSLAWLAATRLKGSIDASFSYYGGQIFSFANERPQIPIIMHFGRKDDHIPEAKVREFAKAHPELPIHLYDAGHGFNCDMRASYDAPSARLAEQRNGL